MITALAFALITKLQWVPVEAPEGYTYCGFTEMGLAFRKEGSYKIRKGPNDWFEGEMPWPNLKGHFSYSTDRQTSEWGTYRVDFSSGTPTWINVGERQFYGPVTENTLFKEYFSNATVILDWNSSNPVEKNIFEFPPFEQGVAYRLDDDYAVLNSSKFCFRATPKENYNLRSYVFDCAKRTVTVLPKYGNENFMAWGFYKEDLFGRITGSAPVPAAVVNGVLKVWPLSTFQPLVGNEEVRAGFIESMSPRYFTGKILYGNNSKMGELEAKSFLLKDGKLDLAASQSMNQFRTTWGMGNQNFYLTPADELIRLKWVGDETRTLVPLLLVRK